MTVSPKFYVLLTCVWI